MSATTKTTGTKIMDQLVKHGAMTTEALAKAVRVPEKDIYSRAWWLQNKDGLLKSRGKGKERTWDLSAKGKKALEAEQAEAESAKPAKAPRARKAAAKPAEGATAEA